MTLYLDDCSHCACVTWLPGWTKDQAIEALNAHELGCDNCMEDQEDCPDGHFQCVALYDEDQPDVILWDGRCG